MTPWGHFDLVALIEGAARGKGLPELAQIQNLHGGGVTAQDCDLALWAKFGRTIFEALNVLNGCPGRAA